MIAMSQLSGSILNCLHINYFKKNMETFTELNLNPSLMQSITRMHFKIPTPIQAQAIPPALAVLPTL